MQFFYIYITIMDIKIIDISKLYEAIQKNSVHKYGHNLSIRNLASIIGVSKSSLGKILTGTDVNYSFILIVKICIWLNQPVDNFIRDRYKKAIKSIQEATEYNLSH